MPEGSGGGRPQFRLGELLLQAGAITRAQLSAGLAAQARVGGRLGSNLIELGAVDERTIAHVLANQLNIPSATAAQLDRTPRNALDLVPRELAERHRAVPIRIDGKRLWVAFADPTDRDAVAALEQRTGHEVRPMVAPDVLIDYALDKHYGVRRRARVIEVRDAELLEVEPVAEVAVYNPHAGAKQASPALGFLDERAPAPPQQVVRAVDADGLRARLLAAATDEDVFSRLLEALQPAAARLAIFLLRGGVLVAHRGHGIDPRALQLARLPIADSPELVKLLEAATPYVGPLPSQLGSLFQQAGAPNGLCLPITLGKRAIGVLVAGMIDPALAQQGLLLLRIATMVDLALHAGHVRARLAKA